MKFKIKYHLNVPKVNNLKVINLERQNHVRGERENLVCRQLNFNTLEIVTYTSMN